MTGLAIRARAVLFDMDGTLVDSNAVVEQVWSEFADALGVPADEVIDFAHGRPSRDTIAKFTPSGESVDEWLAWIVAAETTRFGDMVAIPGAVDVVRSMPAGTWAVVTSALHDPAVARLESVGFPDPAVLIGADDVTHGKPDPEGYARAARELGFEPADCVVFEDTPAGVEAGRRAGCVVVAVGAADVGPVEARISDFTGVSVHVDANGDLQLLIN